ncbi:GNAT family N-acetyltransferase [Streptococcus dentiloxodontae]
MDGNNMRKSVRLELLKESDREQFIRDNQESFAYGAQAGLAEKGASVNETGEIISRETIERSIDSGQAYRIIDGGKKVGGLVVNIEGCHGELDLLFILPAFHSKGLGYAAWCAVEERFPEVTIWTTVTPYFEKRNIHFYVNRCGFHIVEFFNSHHPDPNETDRLDASDDEQFSDGMFRFEKRKDKPI